MLLENEQHFCTRVGVCAVNGSDLLEKRKGTFKTRYLNRTPDSTIMVGKQGIGIAYSTIYLSFLSFVLHYEGTPLGASPLLRFWTTL